MRFSQAVRDIELELHTEIYPGTEVMRDVGTHHFVKGGEDVLVPQPSDDEYVFRPHGFSDVTSCANMQCDRHDPLVCECRKMYDGT
jgi:hypothetical protein